MTDLKTKKVNYTERDYAGLKNNIVEKLIKYYYGDKYTDFNDSSIGGMLIDMAAYVGDQLNYYIDYNTNQILNPTTRKNAIAYARLRGYQPRASYSSAGVAKITIEVPATGDPGSKTPNTDYCPTIQSKTKIGSNLDGTKIYETVEDVNFAELSDYQSDRKTTVVVSEVDGNNLPTKFSITKEVPVISGESKTFTYTFNTAVKYAKLQMPSNKVSEIISVVDSNSNNWYEVESLAQDTIFSSTENKRPTALETPYLMKLLKTSKKFEVEIDENNLTYLVFGPGTETVSDEEIIPSAENVMKGIQNNIDVAISPENFLKTQNFGEAPHDTTLTITYRESNGYNDNALAGELTQLKNIKWSWPIDINLLNATLYKETKSSTSITNEFPITGGRTSETAKEIKENADNSIFAQKRCVTKNDYIIRSLMMPSKFGSISKVYAEKAKSYIMRNNEAPENNKYLSDDIVIHILSYDTDGKLANANNETKENLRTYLSQYRMLSDTIHIVDGKIVNMGIDYKISVKSSFNKMVVMNNTINKLIEYFDITKRGFNQEIILSDLYELINSTEGVLNVPVINLIPKYGNNYSNNYVSFKELIFEGIVYPPDDVSIYEIKYPKKDIYCQVI